MCWQIALCENMGGRGVKVYLGGVTPDPPGSSTYFLCSNQLHACIKIYAVASLPVP